MKFTQLSLMAGAALAATHEELLSRRQEIVSELDEIDARVAWFEEAAKATEAMNAEDVPETLDENTVQLDTTASSSAGSTAWVWWLVGGVVVVGGIVGFILYKKKSNSEDDNEGGYKEIA